MALFSNYATLSYGGLTMRSNTVTGEILETVSAAKTAVVDEYGPDGDVTYAVSLVNSGDAAVTGLNMTDDLGGYTFGTGTVYPLAYKDGSMRYYVNGALQAAPAVVAGPPMSVSGISVPAGGSAMLIYEAVVTDYAPLGADGSIVNTATLTGGGISVPVEAQETVTAEQSADLTVNKAVSPAAVAPNGLLTYTFVIENTGNAAAGAAENAVLADTFDPVLGGISVTFNGAPWAAGTNYTYNETSGEFSTLPGQITVPAASYTQNPDGTWAVEPGSATLVISGTVEPSVQIERKV